MHRFLSRRVAATIAAGVAITAFGTGYAGSTVERTPSAETSPDVRPHFEIDSTNGSSFWSTGETPAARWRLATEASEATGCRPVSPLVPPCEEPGQTAGVLVGADRWRPLVEEYFRAGDVERAMTIMRCESNGDPDAANPTSTASGLFQHLASEWDGRAARAGWEGADVFDPEANVAVAAWLVYEGGGWGHWNASAHCW